MAATGAGPASPSKAKRATCNKCGITAPAPIVVGKKCGNAGACAKRVRKNKEQASARAAAAAPNSPATETAKS